VRGRGSARFGFPLDVSILIPAFRPTFLRQAIASALTQGGEKFDILISDDSGGEDVLRIVETFRDLRIRYIRTSGRTGAGENCRNLWANCDADRMMFLFDDDLLMPHAMSELGAALDATPQAAFAYGRRYVIDAAGRITRGAPPDAANAVVTGDRLAAAMVGKLINHVGELSNVMINRARGATIDDLLLYGGIGLHVVADVALYLNATLRGPAVAVGKPVAAFRLHGAQNSSPAFNPKFAIGIVEWELFLRGEYDRGRLPPQQALEAIEKLHGAYGVWSKDHPAIRLMAPGLERLRDRVLQGDTRLLDEDFRAAWTTFIEAVSAPAPA
jgi:glycosyltransferase involved in cell wall biosynthesis